MKWAASSLSERVYALLLRLLPSDIRESYGADMRALFRDHVRDERRRAGMRGILLLWLRTIPDLVYTAIHEREGDMMTAIGQDARYALRILRKQPIFTFVAVVVVALGTGAVSTIFSVANAIVLRPVPGVGHPDQVVTIERTRANGQGSRSVSYPYYQHLANSTRSLSGIAAWDMLALTISTGGDGTLAQANVVTANYFDVLGARPALGRFFTPDEDRDPGAHAVVVISHELWQRRFGADSSIIGRSILVNEHPFVVVGVAAPGFSGLYPILRIDAWVPMMMEASVRRGDDMLHSVSAGWLELVGRVVPGATHESARAELVGLTKQFATTIEAGSAGDIAEFTGVRVTSASGLPSDASTPVLAFFVVLIAVSALVLTIASVNVASMLLARATARRREIAVRMALGAARSRLVRQLLTESIILFAAGGAVGTLLTIYVTRLLTQIRLPLDAAVFVDVTPDARVLAVALVVALVTGVVFGLAPALGGSRADLATIMRGDSAAAGRTTSRLRNALVAAQVAASMLLLTTSGLFVRALARGHQVDPGYDIRHIATASFDVGLSGYDSTRAKTFYAALRGRLSALPGVTSVGYTRVMPLAMNMMGRGITVPGYTPPAGRAGRQLTSNADVIDENYFNVLRLPLIAGRGFRAADDASAPHVAVVSETFARTYWPGRDALGHTFSTGEKAPITVVGVARDVKFARLTEEPAPFIYLPMAQDWRSDAKLLVRTTGDPSRLARPIREAVHALDPRLPPPDVVSLEDAASIVLMPQRFAVIVTATLGALGLLLAAIGLYGVVSFSTTQRTREIGVRMALGAAKRDVVRLIVGDGMRVVVVGIAIGLVAALVATRALRPFLFGVDPLDAATFVCMALILAGAALVASIVPARRAAAADPVLALRQD
jgi:putative ABC transport system permease protein